MSFAVFIVSIFVFLSGVLPFSYVGISLVLASFLFWGRNVTVLNHAWGGFLAGGMIDAYSALPFGTHIVLFTVSAFLMGGAKIFLKHRYLWGDLGMITGVLAAGDVALPAAGRFFGYDFGGHWISLGLIILRMSAFIITGLAVWFFLRYEYFYAAPRRLLYRR